eukprot:843043-Lingulodinium_polyedra.AAC.1
MAAAGRPPQLLGPAQGRGPPPQEVVLLVVWEPPELVELVRLEPVATFVLVAEGAAHLPDVA